MLFGDAGTDWLFGGGDSDSVFGGAGIDYVDGARTTHSGGVRAPSGRRRA
jgi:Ca2+-binding RTX toxin-like protein